MAGRTAQNAASGNTKDPGARHELVTLDAFSPPGLTRASQWQRSWRAARRWLYGREGQKARARREASLIAPGEEQLTRWLRAPDAADWADALERCLADTEAPVVMLVTPPHGDHAAAVTALARARGMTLLTPPAPAALRDDDAAWMAALSARSRWAVPALERHFLRRVDGMGSVRRFLERAQTGALGRGIIGCDSWCHAYLKHAVGLEGLPAFTPRALGGKALGKRLAALPGPHCPVLLSSRTHKPAARRRRYPGRWPLAAAPGG